MYLEKPSLAEKQAYSRFTGSLKGTDPEYCAESQRRQYTNSATLDEIQVARAQVPAPDLFEGVGTSPVQRPQDRGKALVKGRPRAHQSSPSI